MLILSSLAFTAKDASAQTNENIFLQSINSQRTERGLDQLQMNGELSVLAADWSKVLATQKTLLHSDLITGVTQNWKKLGENVGSGSSAQSIATAFINSPGHLQNIIDPSFQTVGIGVTIAPDNTLYVVEKFMQLTDLVMSKPIPTTTIIVVPPTLPPVTIPEPTTTITTTTMPPTTTQPTIEEAAPKVVSPVDSGSVLKRFRIAIANHVKIIITFLQFWK